MVISVLIDVLPDKIKLYFLILIRLSAIERLDKGHDFINRNRACFSPDLNSSLKERTIRIQRHSIGFSGICVRLIRELPCKEMTKQRPKTSVRV